MRQSSSASEPDATARNEQSQPPEKPKQTNTVLIVKVAVILAITIAIWFIPVPPGWNHAVCICSLSLPVLS